MLGARRGGRLLVLLLVAAAIVAFFASGAHRYLSFERLKAEQAHLDAWYRAHPAGTVAAFFVLYVAVTGLSIPGATVLTLVAGYEDRRPVIDGCEFRESLQSVGVEGSVAPNVVPDRARLVLNHRFAPDRDAEEAFASLRDLLAPALDTAAGDTIEVESVSHPAPPALDHPLLAQLVDRSGVPPRAKLGWTDVAFFSALGVPATNFGPGDSTLAHTATERVARDELEAVYGTLWSVVRGAPVD